MAVGDLIDDEPPVKAPRRLVRPGFVAVVAVVVLLLGALVAVRPALSGVERFRYTRALDAVSRVDLPGPLVLDRTLTACNGVGVLCATSTLPPREATEQIRAKLRSEGIGLDGTRCGADLEKLDPWRSSSTSTV